MESEAAVNSRPLTYVPEDPQFTPIRPMDILIPGLADSSIAMYSPMEFNEQDPDFRIRLSTSALVQESLLRSMQKSDEFWDRWRTHYLSELHDILATEHINPRSTTKRTPELGDLVLLEEKDTPRTFWKTGRIIALPTNTTIRSATIRLPNGTIIDRSLRVLYPLELQATPSVAVRLNTQQDDTRPPPRRSNRIRFMPPTTYLYIQFLLCILGLVNGKEPGQCGNAVKINLTHLDECLSTGHGIYQTLDKESPFCWESLQCSSGQLRRINLTSYSCGQKCECPSWASYCSAYHGTLSQTSKEVLQNYTATLMSVKPILCSDQHNESLCQPNTTTKFVNMIQLFDNSLHMVQDLQLKITDSIFMEQPTCYGHDALPTGTPAYCANFPCKEKSQKFCYYQDPEITFLVINQSEIPIKRWGTKRISYKEFRQIKPEYCSSCKMECDARTLQLTMDGHGFRHFLCTQHPDVGIKCVNSTEIKEYPFPEEFISTQKTVTIYSYKDGTLIFKGNLSCPREDICATPNCTICVRYGQYYWKCTSSWKLYLELAVLWMVIIAVFSFCRILHMGYRGILLAVQILCSPFKWIGKFWTYCYGRKPKETSGNSPISKDTRKKDRRERERRERDRALKEPFGA